jgi:hypothetical protein
MRQRQKVTQGIGLGNDMNAKLINGRKSEAAPRLISAFSHHQSGKATITGNRLHAVNPSLPSTHPSNNAIHKDDSPILGYALLPPAPAPPNLPCARRRNPRLPDSHPRSPKVYRLPSEDDAPPSSTAPSGPRRMIRHAPRVPSHSQRRRRSSSSGRSSPGARSTLPTTAWGCRPPPPSAARRASPEAQAQGIP